MAVYRRPQRRWPKLLVLVLTLAAACLLYLLSSPAGTNPTTTSQVAGSAQRTAGTLGAPQALPAAELAAAVPEEDLAQGQTPSAAHALPVIGVVTEEMRRRCQGTLGDWCAPYLAQQEVPAVTAPPGNKSCAFECNGVGNCNRLTGMCQCPAGWKGDWCTERMPRHCVSKYHSHGFEQEPTSADVSEGIGKESHWAFPRGHCAGACDEDVAACYCAEGLPYGRVPAPPGAPPGTPPLRRGRPLGLYCQPNKTEDGRDSNWGVVDPDLLYNPEYGWCTAAQPKHDCGCYVDGLGGRGCEERYEMTCLNQCNGHGVCNVGLCKCDEGFFGHDCAHRAPGVEHSPGLAQERPWVGEHVHTPAAADFEPGATRRRPLIYVYELPSLYNTLMLQYRIGGEDCLPRTFSGDNATVLSSWTYALESGLHEMILQSEHRTLNPEEADFFYVPIYTSCFINPVRDFADHPWFYSVSHNRAQSATNMQLEAWHWLRSHLPYWDRRGGRDHILLVTHDEASCYVPAAMRPAIILSHWGRKDHNHTSNTAYGHDNYSAELQHPEYEPHGFQRKIQGHACYDPKKDMVVPLMKRPSHYWASPLLGAPARERTYLCFHRGRVQFDNPKYSRGLRQRLAKAAQEGKWLEKYKIVVGGYEEVPGDYSELLAQSKFCLVVPGDGWSARMDDSVLHGCVPVIIMDEVDVSWNTLLDWGSFSLRIPEAQAEQLPQALLAVEPARLEAMQLALARVWRRFAWTSYRPYTRLAQRLMASNRERRQREGQSQEERRRQAGEGGPAGGGGLQGAPPQSLPPPEGEYDPGEDDAFQTLMQWLFSRIPDTR